MMLIWWSCCCWWSWINVDLEKKQPATTEEQQLMRGQHFDNKMLILSQTLLRTNRFDKEGLQLFRLSSRTLPSFVRSNDQVKYIWYSRRNSHERVILYQTTLWVCLHTCMQILIIFVFQQLCRCRKNQNCFIANPCASSIIGLRWKSRYSIEFERMLRGWLKP